MKKILFLIAILINIPLFSMVSLRNPENDMQNLGLNFIVSTQLGMNEWVGRIGWENPVTKADSSIRAVLTYHPMGKFMYSIRYIDSAPNDLLPQGIFREDNGSLVIRPINPDVTAYFDTNTLTWMVVKWDPKAQKSKIIGKWENTTGYYHPSDKIKQAFNSALNRRSK